MGVMPYCGDPEFRMTAQSIVLTCLLKVHQTSLLRSKGYNETMLTGSSEQPETSGSFKDQRADNSHSMTREDEGYKIIGEYQKSWQ